MGAELLTAAQYARLAENLVLPTQAFVDGAFQPALSGETFETTNPATGAVLAQISS
jgi:gamma-glutamyl-gamma-aminobutyraldehyde dehydrogenase